MSGYPNPASSTGAPMYGTAQDFLALMGNSTVAAPNDGSTAMTGFLVQDPARSQQGVFRTTPFTNYVLADGADRLRQFLTPVITGLALQSMDWINQVLFPLNFTDSLVMTFQRQNLKVPLATEVPAMGLVKLMERSSTSWSVAMVRLGLGDQFELERLGTPEGRNDFENSIRMLSESMARTAAANALAALQNPDPENKVYYATHGPSTNYQAFIDRVNRECYEFGVFQKYDLGAIEITHKTIKLIKERVPGSNPNLFICAHDVQTFLRLGNPLTYVFNLAGPDGPPKLMNVEGSPGTFVGLSVFNPPWYDPSQDTGQTLPSPTDVEVRIGGINTISNHAFWDLEEGYKTNLLDHVVFDESNNGWHQLGPLKALWHTDRFDAYGRPKTEHRRVSEKGYPDLLNYKTPDGYSYRQAWAFGQLEHHNLWDNVVRAVAHTAVNQLSQANRDAIQAGMELFDKILDTPALGATATEKTALQGKASYLGLYELAGGTSEYRSPARAFLPAWKKLYSILAIRFGDRYNPALDSRKLDTWFKGLPKDHQGPAVLFQATMVRGVGLSAKPRPAAGLDGMEVLDAAGRPVKLDLATVVDEFERAFNEAEKKESVPLNMGIVIPPIRDFMGVLSNDEAAAVRFAKILGALTHGRLYTGTSEQLVTFRQFWQEFDEVASKLFARKATLAEFDAAVTSWMQMYAYNGAPGPVDPTTAKPTVFIGNIPAPTEAEFLTAAGETEVKFLTPADKTGQYYTPESGYTVVAPWEGRKEEEADEPLFKSPNGMYAFFYDEPDDNAPQPPRDVEMAAKRGQLYPEMDEPRSDRAEFHMQHESYPFRQPNMLKRINEAWTRELFPWYRAARIAFLAAPITLGVLKAMLDNDVQFPFEFGLWRLFKGYSMGTVWIAEGGAQTGVTNYGRVNVLTEIEAPRKMAKIHATWYLSTVVIDPGRIAPLRNVYWSGTRGGAGVKFFHPDDITALKNNGWRVTDPDTPDFISMLWPVGTAATLPEFLDVRGSFDADFSSERGQHYPTAAYENEIRAFHTMTNPYVTAGNNLMAPRTTNTIAFRDTQYFRTTLDGSFRGLEYNKGPAGKYEYPGVRSIRRGEGGIIDPNAQPLTL